MPDGCTKFCYNGSCNMGTKSAEFYLKHQCQVPSNVVSIDTDQSFKWFAQVGTRNGLRVPCFFDTFSFLVFGNQLKKSKSEHILLLVQMACHFPLSIKHFWGDFSPEDKNLCSRYMKKLTCSS